VRGVATTIWDQLHLAVFRAAPATAESSATAEPSQAQAGATTAGSAGGLPTPTEGERIPAPHEGGPTTPDGSIYTVWTSPTEHHLVFVHPGDRERYEELQRRMAELADHLPDRTGSATAVLRFNQVSRWFPWPVFWVALGLIGVVARRPANVLALSVPAVAAFIVILLSALAIAAVPQYAVPVTPGMLLFGAAALFGPRRSSA